VGTPKVAESCPGVAGQPQCNAPVAGQVGLAVLAGGSAGQGLLRVAVLGARRGGKLQQYSQTPGDLLHRKKTDAHRHLHIVDDQGCVRTGQPAYAQARRC
jgi:hypothetical protein